MEARNESYFDGGINKKTIIKIIYLMLAGFLFFPVFYNNIESHLDGSWCFILNKASEMGWKFGKDISFTYGPLGYLCFPQNIGNNILVSEIFWLLIYVINIFLLIKLLFFDKKINDISSINYIFSAILIYIFFHCFSGFTEEYYLCYLVLFSVSMAWFGSNKYMYFLIAAILTVLLFFIKFSGAILGGGTVVLFVLLNTLKEKRVDLKLVGIAASIPIICLSAYLVYNPNIGDFFKYVRSAIEISSGYSMAMSINFHNEFLIAAIFSAAMFMLFIISIFFIDKSYALYMLTFSGAYFLIFKHGFIRAEAPGGHIFRFFSYYLLFASLWIQFIDVSKINKFYKKKKLYEKLAYVFVLAAILPSIYSVNRIVDNSWLSVLPDKYHVICNKKREALDENRIDVVHLENSFLDIIGEEKVCLYPIDLTYGQFDNVNWNIVPVLQAYSAFTPYLDGQCADYLSNIEKTEYLFLNPNAIDNRYAYIETPKTWESIYTNYYVEKVEEDTMLLKRSENQVDFDKTNIFSDIYNKDEKIEIPALDRVLTARVEFELTGIGKLFKAFFRIPQVNMEVEYESGKIINKRIIPDNLVSDFIINYLPTTMEETVEFLNTGKMADKVKYITFNGDGLKYFKKNIVVEFKQFDKEKEKLKWESLAFLPSPLTDIDLKEFKVIDDTTTLAVDYVKGIPLAKITKEDLGNSIWIEGWALDDLKDSAPSKVCIKINDKIYEAKKTDRSDVAAYFEKEEYTGCGFEAYVSLLEFSKEQLDISMLIFSADGKGYYEIKLF